MSILPSQAQGSTSSSSFDSSPPLNPNLDHGSSVSQSPSSLSRQFQSMEFFSGPSLPAAENSGQSSRKVSELVTPNGKRSLPLQNEEHHSGGRGLGSPQSKGKMSGAVTSHQGQQNTGSISAQGNNAPSSGRRTQMMNANHLLNFHYDPIAPQPRTPAPPPRRQQRIKPYNKDLFLQANYKFVLLDTGNYVPESMDPDKMLKWDEIICVRYSTPFPVQCPICLEYPLCPQITSCGHIFCFPCILQYLLMGEENHKGDCLKRCPLCFVMVSQKDLYTICIEKVKHYRVGDTMEFMLLTRQKDSFTPLQKNKQENDAEPSCNDVNDPFSKFTFTLDVELSVRKAISDLDGWLARANSGLVDDLEKLPYFCAAMEQLEQRKKNWNDQKASSKHKSSKYIYSHKVSQALLSTANATVADQEACSSSPPPYVDVNCKNKWLDNEMLDVIEPLESRDENFSSSYEKRKTLQKPLNSSKDTDSYNFYQAVDGQHFILHPLNMKCLLHHYRNYDLLPHRISGKILQLETVTQSEAMRRRYRFLSHFSLTTTFQLCEIDLSEMLPRDALSPLMDEIKRREKQRKQLAKKERKEQIKAEAAAAAYSIPILSSIGQSSHYNPPEFSMDDFEALGSSPVMSSSPPIAEEKILFSNVARLGFAAGRGSPALKIETSTLHNVANDSSGVTGSRNSGTPSFANVISKAKSGDNMDVPKVNEIGKKGKKPSRVLLSTASGRRY